MTDETHRRGESEPATAVRLRALQGRPLENQATRGMVIAIAEALAERQGIVVRDLRAEDDCVTIVLDAPRIVAIGFAAELRRLTTSWFTKKYGAATLWGEPEDEGDAWKQA